MNIDRVEPKNISRRKAVLVGSSAIAATCAISKADNHKAKKVKSLDPQRVRAFFSPLSLA